MKKKSCLPSDKESNSVFFAENLAIGLLRITANDCLYTYCFERQFCISSFVILAWILAWCSLAVHSLELHKVSVGVPRSVQLS